MSYNKNDLKGIGDVYGGILNKVKKQTRIQEKSVAEDQGNGNLEKAGGPESADGFEKPKLDTRTMTDKERVANYYKMNELSDEDEEISTEEEEVEDEEEDTPEEDEEVPQKRVKTVTENINNRDMSKKKIEFSFDSLYESVMGGEIEGGDDLTELGIGDGMGDEIGDEIGDEDDGDEVTISLPRDVAQQFCDALSAILGDGSDDLGDEEGVDGEVEDNGFDFEEDEEGPTDKVGNDGNHGHALHGARKPNMGTNNKVGNLKPSGGDKSGKPTDKVGNDGDHGHALKGAKQPDHALKSNKVGNLSPGKGAFD